MTLLCIYSEHSTEEFELDTIGYGVYMSTVFLAQGTPSNTSAARNSNLCKGKKTTLFEIEWYNHWSNMSDPVNKYLDGHLQAINKDYIILPVHYSWRLHQGQPPYNGWAKYSTTRALEELDGLPAGAQITVVCSSKCPRCPRFCSSV